MPLIQAPQFKNQDVQSAYNAVASSLNSAQLASFVKKLNQIDSCSDFVRSNSLPILVRIGLSRAETESLLANLAGPQARLAESRENLKKRGFGDEKLDALAESIQKGEDVVIRV